MNRKKRMEFYIGEIYAILERLPCTKANDLECRALWLNLYCSHPDIIDLLHSERERNELDENRSNRKHRTCGAERD